MNIWLINPYGTIPGEEWRNYCFADFGIALAEHDINATWFTSSFSHHFKKQRNLAKTAVAHCRFEVKLIKTPSYKSNFGIGRLWRDLVFTFRLSKELKSRDLPDAIIIVENPCCLGYPVFLQHRYRCVPKIVHQMDIWPEFFVEKLPKLFRPIAHLLLAPVYAFRRNNYSNCWALTALSKKYLEFATKISKRRTNRSLVIYNGVSENQIISSLDSPPRKDVNLVFAGTLGPSYDIELIVTAARMCGPDGPVFHIAGSGPKSSFVEEHASTIPNLVFHGVLAPENLKSLYASCDIGLITYKSYSNVEMPDKFYDYTSNGLACLNSLSGEVRDIIKEKELGESYQAEDIDSFLSAVNRLVSQDRSQLRENAVVAAHEFSKEKQLGRFVQLINEVGNDRS